MKRKRNRSMMQKLFSGIRKIQHPLLGLAALGVAIVLVVGGLLYIQSTLPKPGPVPTTFGECIALYKVTEGFPRTCSVPWGGPTFVEYVGNLNRFDTEVRFTDLPPAPVLMASPFVVHGEALPEWFTGAGLEARLVAGEGVVIGSTTVQMSTAHADSGYEAFTVSIPFVRPTPGTQGAFVLKNSVSGKTLVSPVVY